MSKRNRGREMQEEVPYRSQLKAETGTGTEEQAEDVKDNESERNRD